MKESEKAERRSRCTKGNILYRVWFKKEVKNPVKPSRGLGRWLVRGSLRKDSKGKEKLKHCLENVGHL